VQINRVEVTWADYQTHRVGEKKGLYDMHDNASEWALDQFQADWYRSLQGKTTPGGSGVMLGEICQYSIVIG